MTDELRVERYSADSPGPGFLAIEKLYSTTYRDSLDDPFFAVDRFMERIRFYAQSPGFAFVLGAIGGECVGLALGYSLPAGARWWQGLTTPVDPELITEDGTRTYALCELMIHPDWQGQGIGRTLHDELLFKRSERRATLLVEEGNHKAQRLYEGWGWEVIGTLRPGWPDAPHLYALILDLEQSRGRS